MKVLIVLLLLLSVGCVMNPSKRTCFMLISPYSSVSFCIEEGRFSDKSLIAAPAVVDQEESSKVER